MAEVMSIAVSAEDQWLVANGRPVEYYAGDTAFVDGSKVWASERAARRLGEALGSPAVSVDFVAAGGFPDAEVTTASGTRNVVRGASSMSDLGLTSSDPADIDEEDLVILARELVARAGAGGEGVEPAEAATAAASR